MHALVRCPTTSKQYEVELSLKAIDMTRLWNQTISTDCPHCGSTHLDGFKQLYLQSALSVGGPG